MISQDGSCTSCAPKALQLLSRSRLDVMEWADPIQENKVRGKDDRAIKKTKVEQRSTKQSALLLLCCGMCEEYFEENFLSACE